MRKSKNIFLLKGETKKLRKAIALISRTHGSVWIDTYPLDNKIYFAFRLNDKLVRRIKMSKLQNKISSKKLTKLYTLINNCRRFDTVKDFESFKKKNKKLYKYRPKSLDHEYMPKSPKKDNQRLSYGKSEWSKMDKDQLIKAARNINGSKVRKPRKNASKQKWINFLEMFSNKRWDEKNE